jgi:hypothetical protein
MPITIDGLVEYGEENASDISEAMLGDIIEIMTGRAADLTFSSGEWQDGDAAGTFRIRRRFGIFESEDLDVGEVANLATTNGGITNYAIETLLTGDLIDGIIYKQGGTAEYPDQGQEAVGASATFKIIYRTQTGNPYQQIT